MRYTTIDKPELANRLAMQFKYGNEIMVLTVPQFEQAVRDGKLCKCGDCLACRAAAYKYYQQTEA